MPRTSSRLTLERAPAGSVVHAVAEEGVTIRAIAEVIGRQLDLPLVAVSPDDAPAHLVWMVGFLAADSPALSILTRELLGWNPSHPGLIDDLDRGHYFRTPAA